MPDWLPPLLARLVAVVLLAFVVAAPDASAAIASPPYVITVSTAPLAGAPPPAASAGTTASEAASTTLAFSVELVERAVVHIQTEDNAGSGFVVAGGRVITNLHVVQQTELASVWFPNGARRDAVVVARNELLDLAVLLVPRIPASVEPLTLIEDGDPTALGSTTTAWGYPFEADVVAAGFSRAPTVSAGIISARRVREGVHYLQTDAAVNPGNSGGPLLDGQGRVIGVTTLVLTPGGRDAEGLNFALDILAHASELRALLAEDQPPGEP
jgi:S1-C subfamily serine protease